MAMANPFSQAIQELVRVHPRQYTYRQVAERFGISEEQVRGIARSNPDIFNLFKKTNNQGGIIKTSTNPSSLKGTDMRKSAKTLSAEARMEAQLRAHVTERGDINRKHKAAPDEVAKMQKALDAALAITKRQPNIYTIKPTGQGGVAVPQRSSAYRMSTVKNWCRKARSMASMNTTPKSLGGVSTSSSTWPCASFG
jgi:hypothetical protein